MSTASIKILIFFVINFKMGKTYPLPGKPAQDNLSEAKNNNNNNNNDDSSGNSKSIHIEI